MKFKQKKQLINHSGIGKSTDKLEPYIYSHLHFSSDQPSFSWSQNRSVTALVTANREFSPFGTRGVPRTDEEQTFVFRSLEFFCLYNGKFFVYRMSKDDLSKGMFTLLFIVFLEIKKGLN